MSPDEFSIKTPVTIGLIIWIAVISFSLGMIYAKIIDNEKEHEHIREFVEQEVSGLRADWERDRVEKNRRLEKLEK